MKQHLLIKLQAQRLVDVLFYTATAWNLWDGQSKRPFYSDAAKTYTAHEQI